MKAITTYQPWASLIAIGWKSFETRSRRTHYRGSIAIHAGAKSVFPWFQREIDQTIRHKIIEMLAPYKMSIMQRLPLGAVIATAEIVECWEVISKAGTSMILQNSKKNSTITICQYSNEYLFGNFSVGRFAYQLDDVKMLDKPIPAKGQQGLWNWNEEGLL